MPDEALPPRPIVDGKGHHWIPEKVREKLAKMNRLGSEAIEYFKKFTLPTSFYIHRGDTWKGVSHSDYSLAVEQLLIAFCKDVANGGKLTLEQATQFGEFVSTGIFPESLVKANPKAAEDATNWARGSKRQLLQRRH